MNDYLAVGLGMLCAGIGGEAFVRGAVGIGRWLRVPVALIGVTIAAFATSSPELAVAITAASAGTPEISLGDALGSNVVNVSLILALALLITPIETTLAAIRRDLSVALLTPILIGLLALDGRISRLDGLILLVAFCGWLGLVIRQALAHRAAMFEMDEGKYDQRALFFSIVGLFLLVVAGRLIVTGAKGIAYAFGIDPFIIGATVVAVATGTPELAMTLIAVARKHEQLGLGNILGSNIFNGLFIVAVAALISPITVLWNEVALGLFFGVLTTLAVLPLGKSFLGRKRGVFLLALYITYLLVILQPLGQ